MALVLTVEDGSIVTGANSYVSVADATAYFELDPNFLATWTALTTGAKEQYLAWATRILDQKTAWNGTAYTVSQPLRWPRIGVCTREGYAVDSDEVPSPVKHAVCELVKWLQSNDPTTGPDTEAFKRLMVDVIEIEYQDSAIQSNYPTIIGAILTGLGTFRIGGRGSAKIIKV